jgi:hypothetical protein
MHHGLQDDDIIKVTASLNQQHGAMTHESDMVQ